MADDTEERRWRINIGISKDDAARLEQQRLDEEGFMESVRTHFKPGRAIKPTYVTSVRKKPTDADIKKTLPWVEKYGLSYRVEPDRETGFDRALEAFETTANTFQDLMTLGLAKPARTAVFGGALGEGDFKEGMKSAAEYEEDIESQHPYATLAALPAAIYAGSKGLGLYPVAASAGKNLAGKAAGTTIGKAIASRTPGFVSKAAGLAVPAGLTGASYATSNALAEGRLPTAKEEGLGAAAAIAADLALRGTGKLVSKIPGAKKLSSSIDRKVYDEDAFPAARATRGAQEVRNTMGFSKDAAGFKQELMAHTPYNSAANRDPIYLSTDPRVQTALVSVAASGDTRARDALRKDINRRLAVNDRALKEQLAKTTGSEAGLGSPTFTAVNKQAQLAEDKGLREFVKIKPGVDQPMLPVRTGDKGKKTAVDDYLLKYLNDESIQHKLPRGAEVDLKAGTANLAALRHATRNITADNVAENAEINKLAQISAARTLDKEFKRVNPGSTASFEKSILRNRRLGRLEEEFNKAAELPTSKKASYLFDIGKTKDDIDLLSKVYGEDVAKNAQKEVVQARKAGLLSGSREALYNEVPAEGVRYKLPIDNPRVRSAIISDNPELYREMQLHNMLVEARSIMNDPSLSAAKGSRALKKAMASHGIRAAASVTGSYGTQQGLLTLLEAAIALSKKSKARAVSSFLQKPVNQLSTLVGASPLPKSVVGKYFDATAPLLDYLSSKYATPENVKRLKRKKKEE